MEIYTITRIRFNDDNPDTRTEYIGTVDNPDTAYCVMKAQIEQAQLKVMLANDERDLLYWGINPDTGEVVYLYIISASELNTVRWP